MDGNSLQELYEAIKNDDVGYVGKCAPFEGLCIFDDLGCYSNGGFGFLMSTPMCVAVYHGSKRVISFLESIGISRFEAAGVMITDKIPFEFTDEEVQNLSEDLRDYFLHTFEFSPDEMQHPFIQKILEIKEKRRKASNLETSE